MMENPFSVEGIGYQAFYNSQFLREITIPSETYYIKDEAFKGSTIEKIIIGDNVRYVGAEAFANLSNLKDVYMTPLKPISSSHFFWDWNVFEGISEDAILHYSKDDPRVDINQYPFKEFKNFDIIESGIDMTIVNKEELIHASSCQGGISIVNSGTSLQECEIFNIMGIGVKKVIVNPGDNFVDCEKGIYIVKTIEYSEKLIVK